MMSDKFRDKFRIASARRQGWDYGWNAGYFVTICTRNREHYFGKIAEGRMELSVLGLLAAKVWEEIPEQYPFVLLDEFTIMPNHLHGIIIINNQPARRDAIYRVSDSYVSTGDVSVRDALVGDAINNISTEPVTVGSTNSKGGGITGVHNPMQYDNLSRIIRWYKGRVSFEARRLSLAFGWQSRFHDHIIRNGEELERIRKYIFNNPENWLQDEWYAS